MGPSMPRNLAQIIIDPKALMDGARIGELLDLYQVVKRGEPPLPAARERLATLVDRLWVDATASRR